MKKLVKKRFTVSHPKLKRELFGIQFPNPVGLAAGLDKNALAYNELSCLGFGFIEIGTLTPRPQSGNDKPRLFRLLKDEGLLNRMGFNNDGVKIAAERLRDKPTQIIVGGNIGKNKNTPNENATDDYLMAFETLFPYVDYFVVNVSSPNTPNLRELQDKQPLLHLLNEVMLLNNKKEKPKPVLLKIAPDLSDSQLDDIIEIIQQTGIQGIIATNTTIKRDNLKYCKTIAENYGAGGISGKPLTKRSTEVIRYLFDKSDGKIPIIGVGGIHSAKDAMEKLDAGASLIQLYTGFVYEGPGLIREINNALIHRN